MYRGSVATARRITRIREELAVMQLDLNLLWISQWILPRRLWISLCPELDFRVALQKFEDYDYYLWPFDSCMIMIFGYVFEVFGFGSDFFVFMYLIFRHKFMIFGHILCDLGIFAFQ